MPVDFAKVRSVTSTFNVHGLILILEYAVVTVDAVCPSGALSAQSWPANPVMGVRVRFMAEVMAEVTGVRVRVLGF